jgi:hypothetical protein
MARGYDEAVVSSKSVEARNVCGRARPQDALLSDMELPLQREFYPLWYAVEIATNDTQVLEIADGCFRHARMRRSGPRIRVNIGVTESTGGECPREPTRRAHNHLFSLVADADNQALLDLNTCTSFAWVTRSAVRNRLYFRYNFLEKMVYLLLGSSVVTDLHAACVGRNGRGILLCGDSGAGKSTLAYACAREGWTYTSDDTSYLINDAAVPRVIGHAHRVRFRPEAKALFPELDGYQVTPRMEGKPSIEVDASELTIIDTADEAEIGSIVYLKRYPSAIARLVRLPEGAATQRMKKELYSAGEVRQRHEKILERLFAIPTHELHYSDLGGAIRQLETLA